MVPFRRRAPDCPTHPMHGSPRRSIPPPPPPSPSCNTCRLHWGGVSAQGNLWGLPSGPTCGPTVPCALFAIANPQSALDRGEAEALGGHARQARPFRGLGWCHSLEFGDLRGPSQGGRGGKRSRPRPGLGRSWGLVGSSLPGVPCRLGDRAETCASYTQGARPTLTLVVTSGRV